MTEKYARDAVYVVTLIEELSSIEGKIAAMEAALHLGPSATPQVQDSTCAATPDGLDAKWVREKARELDLRLRRVEQASRIH